MDNRIKSSAKIGFRSGVSGGSQPCRRSGADRNAAFTHELPGRQRGRKPQLSPMPGADRNTGDGDGPSLVGITFADACNTPNDNVSHKLISQRRTLPKGETIQYKPRRIGGEGAKFRARPTVQTRSAPAHNSSPKKPIEVRKRPHKANNRRKVGSDGGIAQSIVHA